MIRADNVFGELYRLRAVEDLLREFDMYEACGEGFPEPNDMFVMLLVTPRNDSVVEAWTRSTGWFEGLSDRTGGFL